MEIKANTKYAPFDLTAWNIMGRPYEKLVLGLCTKDGVFIKVVRADEFGSKVEHQTMGSLKYSYRRCEFKAVMTMLFHIKHHGAVYELHLDPETGEEVEWTGETIFFGKRILEFRLYFRHDSIQL